MTYRALSASRLRGHGGVQLTVQEAATLNREGFTANGGLQRCVATASAAEALDFASRIERARRFGLAVLPADLDSLAVVGLRYNGGRCDWSSPGLAAEPAGGNTQACLSELWKRLADNQRLCGKSMLGPFIPPLELCGSLYRQY